jgi:hypothetical protein
VCDVYSDKAAGAVGCNRDVGVVRRGIWQNETIMSMLSSDHRGARAAGLLWFLLISSGIAQVCHVPFLIVFPALLSVVVLLGFLAVAWAARCLANRDVRPGQFGIATLLLLTFYAAVFLSFVQWLVSRTQQPNSATANAQFSYIAITFTWGLLTLASIVPAIYVVDAALWSAVRLTRWRIRTNIIDSNESKTPRE